MNIWQTQAWWDMLFKSWQVEKIINYNWIYIEKRKVSFKEYWLFIIWLDKKLNKEELSGLILLSKKEKVLFLQIENLSYEDISKIFINYDKNFIKSYYKKFIVPYTALIDLNKSEEEILSLMKPKWRYNIKLAEKKWIIIKLSWKSDKDIELFYKLMLDTTNRDGFSWNSLKYYKDFLNLIENSELLLAYKDDIIVSAWIFIFSDEVSIYYYGASISNNNYRKFMASYLLQWEAIKMAKFRWSKLYDFLWVALKDDINSSLSWVTDFKMKFTSDIRNVSESYIYINKKIKYKLIYIFRNFKKLFSNKKYRKNIDIT